MQELSIDYTNCNTKAPQTEANRDLDNPDTLEDIPGDRVTASFKTTMKSQPQWGHAREEYTWPSGVKQDTDVCVLSFEIPNDVSPPVLFYYRLTNFYQNHRRYVKSLDVNQLKGDFVSNSSIKSGECDPLDVSPNEAPFNGRAYYPCGLIANSMFNDTFENLDASNPQVEDGSFNTTYDFSAQDISWSSESDLYGKSKYTVHDVVPPPNWREQYVNGTYDSLSELPDLNTWGAFQVWMRTAGLPTFSKLAMRNDKDVLKTGTYRLKIYDRMNRVSTSVRFYH